MFAQAILADKVVAVIGDRIVLKYDLEVQFQQLKKQGKVDPSMKCKMLEQVIQQKLLLHQAIMDSITISEDEVEGEQGQREQHRSRQ